MEKELKIKVHINSNFEIDCTPDLESWNKASNDEKLLYVEDMIKEYIHDNINYLIRDSIVEY